MITAIRGGDIRKNDIGRGFGEGLSSGIKKQMDEANATAQQNMLAAQISPLLMAKADQLGGPENISMLAQLLSQNPAQLPALLTSLKTDSQLGQEAEDRKMKVEATQASISKSLAEALNIGADTDYKKAMLSGVGKEKPLTAVEQSRKNYLDALTAKVTGGGKPSKKEELEIKKAEAQIRLAEAQIRRLNRGGSGDGEGKPDQTEKEIKSFVKTYSPIRKDIVSAGGEVPLNVRSYAALQNREGRDFTLERMRQRHYPEAVLNSTMGNSEASMNLSKLSNAAERVFRQSFNDMMRDKSLPTSQIPDADTLMSAVVSHFSDLENKIRNADEGSSNKMLSPADQKLLKLNDTEIKIQARAFVDQWKKSNGAYTPPQGQGSTTDMKLATADKAKSTAPGAPVQLDDAKKTALFTAFAKDKVTDPKTVYSKLVGRGLSKQQAEALAREYMLLMQQAVQQSQQPQNNAMQLVPRGR